MATMMDILIFYECYDTKVFKIRDFTLTCLPKLNQGQSKRQHGEQVLGEMKQYAPPKPQIDSCVCEGATVGHGP